MKWKLERNKIKYKKYVAAYNVFESDQNYLFERGSISCLTTLIHSSVKQQKLYKEPANISFI